jgi:hypothetical protein
MHVPADAIRAAASCVQQAPVPLPPAGACPSPSSRRLSSRRVLEHARARPSGTRVACLYTCGASPAPLESRCPSRHGCRTRARARVPGRSRRTRVLLTCAAPRAARAAAAREAGTEQASLSLPLCWRGSAPQLPPPPSAWRATRDVPPHAPRHPQPGKTYSLFRGGAGGYGGSGYSAPAPAAAGDSEPPAEAAGQRRHRFPPRRPARRLPSVLRWRRRRRRRRV